MLSSLDRAAVAGSLQRIRSVFEHFCEVLGLALPGHGTGALEVPWRENAGERPKSVNLRSDRAHGATHVWLWSAKSPSPSAVSS